MGSFHNAYDVSGEAWQGRTFEFRLGASQIKTQTRWCSGLLVLCYPHVRCYHLERLGLEHRSSISSNANSMGRGNCCVPSFASYRLRD